MDKLILPKIKSFQPDFLIVFCGQDTSQFDPNGRQLVSTAGFRYMGKKVREMAYRYANGRLLLVQEGGYAVSYAAFCLNATLEGVLGSEQHFNDPLAYLPEDEERSLSEIDKLKHAY